MNSKEYVLVTQTFIGNTLHSYTRRFKVKCIGGECMLDEKPQMIFIDKTAIPTKTGRGRKGRDWIALLAIIPQDKTWKISEKDKKVKISSVKMATVKINKDAKKELYSAIQRTVDGEKFLFVTKEGKSK